MINIVVYSNKLQDLIRTIDAMGIFTSVSAHIQQVGIGGILSNHFYSYRYRVAHKE